MRQRQEVIAHELDSIRKRQQHLEATNERLQEKAIDIRRSLSDLDLTDAEYQQLRLANEEDIALKDFVAVCLYPSVYLFSTSKPRIWNSSRQFLKMHVRTNWTKIAKDI